MMNIKFRISSVRRYETQEGDRLEIQAYGVASENSSFLLPNGYLTLIFSQPEDISKYEDKFGQYIEFAELVYNDL